MANCQEWKECLIYHIQVIRKDVQQHFGEEPVSEDDATEQYNMLITELAKLDIPPWLLVEELIKQVYTYTNLLIRKDTNADLPRHIRGLYS